jgi:hypothetical protein
VTDSSTPPNPILGASVQFQATVLRLAGGDLALAPGDPTNTQTGMPVILSASQSSVTSDANGLASFVPTVGSFTGLLEVEIQVSAGISATLEDVEESFPASTGGNNSAATHPWAGTVSAPAGVIPYVPIAVVPPAKPEADSDDADPR